MNTREPNLFRLALPYLLKAEERLRGRKVKSPKTPEHRYICNCLLFAAQDNGLDPNPFKQHVAVELGLCFTVERWLVKNGYVKSTQLYSRINIARIQEFRKDWLTHLADNYDKGMVLRVRTGD